MPDVGLDVTMTACLWCVPGLPEEAYDSPNPEAMCLDHLAEWEGLPVIELASLLAEEWAEGQLA